MRFCRGLPDSSRLFHNWINRSVDISKLQQLASSNLCVCICQAASYEEDEGEKDDGDEKTKKKKKVEAKSKVGAFKL